MARCRHTQLMSSALAGLGDCPVCQAVEKCKAELAQKDSEIATLKASPPQIPSDQATLEQAESERDRVQGPPAKKKRKTSGQLESVSAQCRECNWAGNHRNAMGLAAQHHDHTTHTIDVAQTITVTFGDPDREATAASTASQDHDDEIPF